MNRCLILGLNNENLVVLKDKTLLSHRSCFPLGVWRVLVAVRAGEGVYPVAQRGDRVWTIN